MSELFNAIAKFYRGEALPTAKFTDLSFMAGSIAHRLIDGSPIEVNGFDGTVNRTKTIAQISRADTAQCLSQLVSLIIDRLAQMPQAELDRLDLTAEMLNGINAQSLTPQKTTMNESTPLDRFSKLLAPQIDPKFKIDFSLDGDIVDIHIVERLEGLNDGFTIGEFCKNYSAEMLAAIVAAGEEIQRYRISCCDLFFTPQNARAHIKALGDRDKFLALRN